MSTTFVRRKTFTKTDRAQRMIHNFNQAPLSHFDVDEIGHIFSDRIRDLAVSLYSQDGFRGDLCKITQNAGVLVNIDQGSSGEFAVVGGNWLENVDQSTLTMPAKPGVGTRTDLIYLELWLEEKDVLDLPSIDDPAGQVILGTTVPTLSKIILEAEVKVASGTTTIPALPADNGVYLSTTPDDGTPRIYSDGTWGHTAIKIAVVNRDSVEAGGIVNSMIEDVRPFLRSLGDDIFDIVISNQAEFEYWFGTGSETGAGTTEGGWTYSEAAGVVTVTVPAKISIWLNPCDSIIAGDTGTNVYNGKPAYKLNTKVLVPDDLKIWSDGGEDTVVIKGSVNAYFTTALSTPKAGSHASGSNTISIPTMSAGDYEVGDVVGYDGASGKTAAVNPTYKIIDVDETGKTIAVDFTFTGIDAAASVYQTVSNVHFQGWVFDGRGGVAELGGSLTPTAGSFGVFSTLSNSVFDILIVNCKVTGDGGAVDASYSGYTSFKNMVACEAANGGAIDGGSDWIISSAVACVATTDGGVINSSYGCTVFARGCSSGVDGGVISNCANSVVDAFECAATGSGGVASESNFSIVTARLCTAGVSGGAVNVCTSSTVLAVSCSAVNGGAVFSSANSLIIASQCLVTSGDGGAANACTSSLIIASKCSTITSGSGAATDDCDNSLIIASECVAATHGGADNSSPGSLIIASKCISALNGGAAYQCDSSLIVASQCNAADGGAVYDSDDCLIIASFCTVSSDGGAAHTCTDSIIIVSKCDASITNDGGGAYDCDDSIIIASQCTSGRDGAAAWGCSNSLVIASQCVAGDDGGGAYVCANSLIIASQCSASAQGEGAYACDNSLIIVSQCTGSAVEDSTDCVVIASECAGVFGGAANNVDNSLIIASKCTASTSGGAASSSDSSLIIASKCTATVNGGAAYQCDNSLIIASICGAADGGAVYDSDGCLVIASKCTASSEGGGVYDSDNCLVIANLCTAVTAGDYAFNCLTCEFFFDINVAGRLGGTNTGSTSPYPLFYSATPTTDGGGVISTITRATHGVSPTIGNAMAMHIDIWLNTGGNTETLQNVSASPVVAVEDGGANDGDVDISSLAGTTQYTVIIWGWGIA